VGHRSGPDRHGRLLGGGRLAIAVATGFEKRTDERADAIDKVSCRPDFAIAAHPG
jgi:hypothetical protein